MFKQRLKEYLSGSVTIHEVFLIAALFVANFTYRFFPYLKIEGMDDLQGILALLFMVGVFFVIPLYYSARIIFFKGILSSLLKIVFNLFGTIWIIGVVVPVSFVYVFSKLSFIDFMSEGFIAVGQTLSINDYIVIFYLLFMLARILLLFLFSSYLGIQNFTAVNVYVNPYVFFITTAYSFFVLFRQGDAYIEMPIDLFAYIFQNVVTAFVSGSLILNLYSIFTPKQGTV